MTDGWTDDGRMMFDDGDGQMTVDDDDDDGRMNGWMMMTDGRMDDGRTDGWTDNNHLNNGQTTV